MKKHLPIIALSIAIVAILFVSFKYSDRAEHRTTVEVVK